MGKYLYFWFKKDTLFSAVLITAPMLTISTDLVCGCSSPEYSSRETIPLFFKFHASIQISHFFCTLVQFLRLQLHLCSHAAQAPAGSSHN